MKQERIPRTLHYFWDKDKPLSYIQQVCFDSWKEFAPDFKLKRWDEHAFDMNSTAYTRYHFERKSWALLSDYVRFHALVTEGGIYLDTDMQLVKPLDELLFDEAFIGFVKPPEHPHHVPDVEVCCMGSKKSHPVMKKMLNGIEQDFVKRQQVYFPNIRFTRYLKARGLVRYKEQTVRGVHVFTHEAFCPFLPFRDLPPGKQEREAHSSEKDYMEAAKPFLSENSYAIHWFRGSWWMGVEFQAPKSALAILVQKLKASQWLLKIDRLISHFLPYQRLKNVIVKRFSIHNMEVKVPSSGEKK